MNERDPEDEALIEVDALRVVKIMNQDGSHYYALGLATAETYARLPKAK